MIGDGLLCVAFDSAPGACLSYLAADFLARPPRFPWRLALGRQAWARLRRLPGIEPYCLMTDLAADADEATLLPLIRNGEWAPIGLLMSAAGWPVEQHMLRLARANRLRTAQYIETWYGYRRRLRRQPDWLTADTILVVDEFAVDEARQEGLEDLSFRTVGNTVWESIQSGRPGSEEAWLFVSAPIARHYGSGLGYTEVDAWQLVQTVHYELGYTQPIRFALHPADRSSRVPPGALACSYDPQVLHEVGVVLGMFSAPLIDAYLFGNRVISVQPGRTGLDLCPLSRRGLIPVVRDHDSFRSALDKPLSPVDPEFRSGLADSLVRMRQAIEDILV